MYLIPTSFYIFNFLSVFYFAKTCHISNYGAIWIILMGNITVTRIVTRSGHSGEVLSRLTKTYMDLNIFGPDADSPLIKQSSIKSFGAHIQCRAANYQLIIHN